MSAGVCREDVPEDSAACDTESSASGHQEEEGEDLGPDRKSVKVEGGGGWGDELLETRASENSSSKVLQPVWGFAGNESQPLQDGGDLDQFKGGGSTRFQGGVY